MSEAPWWLQPGPETCQFCLRAFHHEAGYHCLHCDWAVCPGCVVERFENREAVCPQCRGEDV
ncbi:MULTISPECIES: hypothetical protein [unclassified Microbulbifer]|uniref:hypothetical protein n=1 Tax=unclassified Microbulbifer TaxID=2619833 RepID=UPI0027E3FE27|nr:MULTISPECIES: hypothetical protein [unclassified Microbulbifer]